MRPPGLRAGALLVDVLLCATAVVPLAAVGIGALMAYRVYRPRRRMSRKSAKDLQLPAEDLRIPVPGAGLELDAWLIRRQQADHTVIVSHELSAHKGTKIRFATFLHDAGYNVLLFDLRNHGNSDLDPKLSGMSHRFTDDFEAVISYLRAREDLNAGGLAAISFSFSTFPAVYVLKRPNCHLDALILDSGPAIDYTRMFDSVMDHQGRPLLPRLVRGPLLFGVVKRVFAKVADGMLGADWPPDMGTLQSRILLIANEEDPVLPVADSTAFARLRADIELWISPGTGHLEAFEAHGQLYQQKLLDFLQRSLPPPCS